MKRIMKYAGFSIIAIAAAVSILSFVGASKASAQVSRNYNRSYNNYRVMHRDNDDRHHRNYRHSYGRNYNRNHHGRIYSDYDYFNRYNLFSRYDRFRNRFPGNICARNYRFINRYDPDDYFYYNNYYGDNDCVNTVYVYVNSDFLDNFRNNLSVNNDLDFYLNTGNNSISFNTVAGSIVTGDATISIY